MHIHIYIYIYMHPFEHGRGGLVDGVLSARAAAGGDAGLEGEDGLEEDLDLYKYIVIINIYNVYNPPHGLEEELDL
jgi:hypothetical protein